MRFDETKEALPRDETLWMASHRDCNLLIAWMGLLCQHGGAMLFGESEVF